VTKFLNQTKEDEIESMKRGSTQGTNLREKDENELEYNHKVESTRDS
jgi:hypothetical protein